MIEKMVSGLLEDFDAEAASIMARAEAACRNMPMLEREQELSRFKADLAGVRLGIVDRVQRLIAAMPWIERNVEHYRIQLSTSGGHSPEDRERELSAYTEVLIKEIFEEMS